MAAPEQQQAASGSASWTKIKFRLGLYLFLVPTIAALGVFNYYPKIDLILMSFYRWIPGQVREFVGVANYLDALRDPLFWQGFKLVGILLMANLIKMWPAIFVAVALHRMFNQRLRYLYQVLFVVPMVIPGLVWLLIWKGFYDPDFGLLNRLLNLTGMMDILRVLDGTPQAPGVMPQIAAVLNPLLSYGIEPVFGSLAGMGLIAVLLLHLHYGAVAGARLRTLRGGLMALAFLPLLGQWSGLGASQLGILLLGATGLGGILWIWRCIGGEVLLWATWYCAALVIFHAHPYHLPIAFAAVFAIEAFVRRGAAGGRAIATVRNLGAALLAVTLLLVVFGTTWTQSTGQFTEGTPAWLGSKDLVIPAVAFWGFPWVGTIGVLIYLAGLQRIPQDVYEAAQLDGVGSIGMFFRVELPLILTQVRINLIFMTIGTLTQYEFFLLLLGSEGGPGNKGLVPGLYMYKKAFEDGHFGYACALGMVLFTVILLLTMVYNRYVKIER